MNVERQAHRANQPQPGTLETCGHGKRPDLRQSFGHAWNGVVYTLRTQRNARIHLVVGVIVAAIAVWLRLDAVRCAILALTIVAVIVGELLNTALEALVDILSPDYHDAAKIAKDVSAGAVLALGVSSVIIGLLILGPPLWGRMLSLLSGAAEAA